MKKIALLILTCLGVLTTPVWAENGVRQETVQFEKGQNSASIKGRIRGSGGIDYLLRAKVRRQATK